jgi:ComF family protein
MPYTCILCHAKSDQQMDLCASCQRDLPYWQHGCRKCGVVLNNDEKICGACLHKPPSFDSTFAMCEYRLPITKLILELKFQQQLVNARILGELMAQRLKQRKQKLPQCIIPVPLSKKRLRERGFNQAVELAKPICKALETSLIVDGCKRIRHTKAQAMIPARQRDKNIKNAFIVDKNFNAKHVAIIDDVVTTGHTVKELSKVLRKAGMETIEVWCCAKTI